ncbi:hypothetical protein [Clostridium chrysemydis]|uniref:hypothetical protein n=1 Tax=Clostridium chrysemydis TaxID=2665504 RepID=UPI0018831E8C|nr:hypothetical protein [Clostridium chrysemydis]
MKRKKIISIILASVMIASVITGCGKDKEAAVPNDVKSAEVQNEVNLDQKKDETKKDTDKKNNEVNVSSEKSESNEKTKIYKEPALEVKNSYSRSYKNDLNDIPVKKSISTIKVNAEVKTKEVSNKFNSKDENINNDNKVEVKNENKIDDGVLNKTSNKDNPKDITETSKRNPEGDRSNELAEKDKLNNINKKYMSAEVFGGEEERTPNLYECLGLIFGFDAGEELNGYTIEIGEYDRGTRTSACIDGDKIILNVDLYDGSDREVIENAINKALKNVKVDQRLKLRGNFKPLDEFIKEGALKEADVPEFVKKFGKISIQGGKYGRRPASLAFLGYVISISEGKSLNGYNFETGKITEGTKTAVKIKGKSIIIDIDLVKCSETKEKLQEEINKAIEMTGKPQRVELSGALIAS